MLTSPHSLITHVDAPLETQVLEAAIDHFSELFNGRRLIGKQVEPGHLVFDNLDRALVNAVVDEMNGDAQFFGKLRDSEAAVNSARMRLVSLEHDPMSEANRFHRAW
jgi:hypothetical protein